ATDNLEFDLSVTRLDIQETPQAGTEIAHNAWTRLEGRYPFPTPLLDISDFQRYAGTAEDAPPTGVLDEAEGTNIEADRVSLSVNWDLEDYGLTSITGYNDSKTRAVTGYDSTYVGHYYFAAPTALVAGAWGLTAAHPAQLVDLTPFIIGALPAPAAAAITGAGLGIYEAQDVSYQTIGGQPNHNREEFSQEFRIQSQLSGPFNWMAGISYSDLDLEEWLGTSVLNPGDALSQALLTFDLMHMEYDGNDPAILTLTEYGTKTESAFFSLEYAATEKLTVTAEGRYTNEEKSAEDTVSNLAGSLGALIPASGKQEDTWEYFSPRVTASYEWDEDTLFYANIGQGTKSGGFNGGASGDKAKYDEETNTTYEIGAKRTVLDGRGYMNISAYFIDWDDQQVREFATSGAPGVPRVVVANLGKTEVKGLEVESAFQIDENWSFRMGYTYNDSEIKEGIVATDVGFTDFAALGMGSIADGCTLFGGAPIPGTACAGGPPFFSYVDDLAVSDGDSSGNQSPNTHKHTVNAGFTYTTNLSMGAEFYASIDAVWKDERYLDSANTLMIDDYTDVNLQVGLNGEHWYGKISAVNLLDDDTPTSAYRPGLWDGSFQQTVINRNGRMVAFSVGYRF
ncbi:MAG: TonB-dependent receptor, partial [Haliea sp.]